MTSAPPRWTTAELAEDAATSASRFRAERLAVTDIWNAIEGKTGLAIYNGMPANP